jgi:hypothetical protein
VPLEAAVLRRLPRHIAPYGSHSISLHNRSERALSRLVHGGFEESQVESYEHQDNANIHCQPFPESVFEEHQIDTDYDGCHRHHVKHDSYLSAHFSQHYRMTLCWSE